MCPSAIVLTIVGMQLQWSRTQRKPGLRGVNVEGNVLQGSQEGLYMPAPVGPRIVALSGLAAIDRRRRFGKQRDERREGTPGAFVIDRAQVRSFAFS